LDESFVFAISCILTSGKILAARLEEQGAGTGYDWCIQELRKSGFNFLAKELLLEKANTFLRNLKLQEAINIYKVKLNFYPLLIPRYLEPYQNQPSSRFKDFENFSLS